MSNLLERPTQIEDIVKTVNAPMLAKLLGEENFTVLSIRPYSEARQVYNAIAEVEIDLFPGTTLEIPHSERYTKRRVPFTRISLLDAMKQAGVGLDSMNRVKVSDISSVDAFITSIGKLINFDADELELLPSTETSAAIRAKVTSLGFTGKITITTEEDEASGPRWVKEGDDFSGSYVTTDPTGATRLPDITLGQMNYLVVTGEKLTEEVRFLAAMYYGSNIYDELTFIAKPNELTVIPFDPGESTKFDSLMAQAWSKDRKAFVTIGQFNTYAGPAKDVVIAGAPSVQSPGTYAWGITVRNEELQPFKLRSRVDSTDHPELVESIEPFNPDAPQMRITFKEVTENTIINLKTVADGVTAERTITLLAKTQ